MRENNKRICKNIAVSVTKSIGCIATEMTILGYIMSGSKAVSSFLHTQVAILPCCPMALDTTIHLGLFVVCVLGWIGYGFKHKYVDKRLVNVRYLQTGDKLYYFKNSNLLESGIIVQIMRKDINGGSAPFAIGIVCNCDEGNDNLMIVRHIDYVGDSAYISPQDYKTVFYYPHIREYYYMSADNRRSMNA